MYLKITVWLFYSFLLIPCVSCNRYFFQPDHVEYSSCADFTAKCESFTVSTKRGPLNAWLLKSKDPADTLIVHFHGNAQNLTAHVHFVSWLADNGYDVLTFDYRGYGKSPGEPERGELIHDGKAIIEYVNNSLSYPNVFVLAQSLGGAIAVVALSENQPKNFRGLILESTFGSYRRLARKKIASLWLLWPFQYPLSLLINDDFSAENYIGQIHAPILIIHGNKDPVVPLSEGQTLYDVTEQNDDVEFWEVAGGGHTPAFLRPKNPLRRDLIGYLKRVKN